MNYKFILMHLKNQEVNIKMDNEYQKGWRTGFYWGIFVMGLFSIFVFIMAFMGVMK